MHYLGVFALSTLLLQKIASRSKLWRQILIVVVVGVTALLSGLRAPSIGSDTSSYPLGCYKFASVSSHYANYDDHVSEFYFMKEIGYKVLAYVSTKIYNDFNFFLFVCAVIVNAGFMYFFWHMSKKYQIPLWLLWLSYYCLMFNQSLNLAKQFLAISFCLIAYVLFDSGRKKLSVFFFCVALTFHFTAIAFLFFVYERFVKSNVIRIGVIVCAAVTLLGNYFLLEKVMSSHWLLSRFASYLSSKNGDVPVFEVMFHSLFLIVPLYLWVVRSVRLKKEVIIRFSYLIIIEISFFLFNMISAQAGRMGMYLLPMCLVYVPLVVTNSRARKPLTLAYAFSLLAFWFITIVYQGSTQSYPYESILD